EAMRNPYSAYVWLNDDVELDRDALSRLWAAHTSGTGQAILGCAMRGSKEGSASYSGSIQEGSHPFRFRRVEPDCARELEVDVLNGNLVLVPCIVTQKIGGFAKYLVHHGGDYEYCRRASRHGFRSRLLPGTFGVCASNPPGQRKRGLAGLRKAASPKHLPIRMGVPLYRESGGPFWWVWLASYYAKAFVKGF
ncbi:glycosyltransferase family 2 protein, partial [bacterium]